MLLRSPADSELRLGWPAALGLTLAGAAVRALVQAALGVHGAFGEDAEYWGYRAAELKTGALHGLHPVMYPGFVAALSWLTGASLSSAGQVLSSVCGCLMAPAVAAASAPLVGRRAAVIFGSFVLALPGLLAASMRFDPTGLFVLAIAAALYASGRALRDLSVPWGTAAAVVVAGACVVKENGLQYAVLLGAIAAVAVQRRKWVLAAAPIVAFVLVLGVLQGVFGEVRGGHLKATVPFRDLSALVEQGVVPVPLVGKEDAAIRLRPAETAELSAPTTTPARRVTLYAGIQARRLWRFLGVWLLLTPLAVGAAWQASRKGTLATWQVWAIVALGSCALPAVFVIVQPRHAEPGMFGVMLGGALGLSELPPRWRRAVVPFAVLIAALQGALLFRAREAAQLQRLAECGQEQDDLAREILRRVGADRLCSPLPWAGFRTGRPVKECDGEGPSDVLVTGQPTWMLLDEGPNDHLEQRLLVGATLEPMMQKRDGCFDTGVQLSRVRWRGQPPSDQGPRSRSRSRREAELSPR